METSEQKLSSVPTSGGWGHWVLPFLAALCAYWSPMWQHTWNYSAPSFPMSAFVPAAAGLGALAVFWLENWAEFRAELGAENWADRVGLAGLGLASATAAVGYSVWLLFSQPIGVPTDTDYFWQATIAMAALAWLPRPFAKVRDIVTPPSQARALVISTLGVALLMVFIWGWASRSTFNFTSERVLAAMFALSPFAVAWSRQLALAEAVIGAAKRGVTVNVPSAFERLRTLSWILVNKTGIITTGERYFVSAKLTRRGGLESIDELIAVAAGLEVGIDHAIARAVCAEAEAREISPADVKDQMWVPGIGISGRLAEFRFTVGGPALLTRQKIDIDVQDLYEADALNTAGNTVIYLVRDDALLGYIAIGDEPHRSAARAIENLHGMRHKVGLITTDAHGVAKHVAAAVGADDVFAEVLPQNRAALVADLENTLGQLAVVADSRYDAAVLEAATVSISVNDGDGDIVLHGSEPTGISAAVFLSHKLGQIQRRVLVIGWVGNLTAVLLGAGIFTGLGFVPGAAITSLVALATSYIAAGNTRSLRGAK